MMILRILQIEIYKLLRHPMILIISFAFGLISLLFYRLCVDYLHLAHHALNHRQTASLTFEVIKPLCSWTILILAIVFPLFTTQTLSQELKQKTFYLWAGSAIKAYELVMGKWLSLMFILLLILCLVFAMILSLAFNTSLSFPMMGLSLVTVAFVGCCFICFGLFISSMIPNPLFSLGMTYFGIIIWMLLEWLNPLGQKYAWLAKEISILSHSYHGLNGIIYSPDICFFIITSALCLCLTHLRVKYFMTKVLP
ncbi:MAG: hypothetical protein JSS07_02140 [Proteobacteria bacterium]|nr:hypothetical protein [Pseudomonadota bacterium]